MFLRAMGVPSDYATAMETAATIGLSDGTGLPSQPVSRIETAQLIVNALRSMGMDPQMTPEDAAVVLAAFSDLGDLSDDEILALAICVRLGIFRGAGGSIMNPNDALQRSQMASLAVRMQDVILGVS